MSSPEAAAGAASMVPGNALGAALRAEVSALVQSELACVRPEFVSQRTVEAVVGLPRLDFLRLARAGAFPSTRERRLILARTVDVVSAFAARMRRPAADGGDDLDAALARVGARRVSH